MTKYLIAVLILVFSTELSACPEMRGEINEHSKNDIIKKIELNHATEIIISSPGGDESASIELGKYLRKNKIKVVVDGVCMSSCSQYILLPSFKSFISNGSLVAFHYSSYYIYEMFKDKNYSEKIKRSAKLAHDQTFEMYKSSNIELEILRDSMIAIHPVCRISDDKMNMISLKTIGEFWVPSADYMKDIGFNINGFWPKSEREAMNTVRRFIKPNSIWRYGDISVAEFKKFSEREFDIPCQLN